MSRSRKYAYKTYKIAGSVSGPATKAALARSMKPTKYGAIKMREDGFTFASRKEHRRYLILRAMYRSGAISDLTVHPRWKIVVNGAHVCDYIADFRYVLPGYGVEVVEDVKGMKGGAAYQMFRLKAKLMFAIHGISVAEV